MKLCPKCKSESDVKDTRDREHGYIWRRRKCKACGYRWGTIEISNSRYRRVQKTEKALMAVANMANSAMREE